MSVFPVAALAQRWTDATALHADFLCRTSNMAVRRIGSRLVWRYVGLALGWRVGLVRLRVGLVRLRVGLVRLRIGLARLCSDWHGCVRTGTAACQKRREWGLIAGGDPRPFAFLEFNKPLSPGVLRKHCLQTASLFLHWDPGLRYFGPHSGVFCRPLLPIPFVERFRWDFRLGFSRALLRRALARLWLGAFL